MTATVPVPVPMPAPQPPPTHTASPTSTAPDIFEKIKEEFANLSPGTIGRVTRRLSRLSYDGYFLSRGELRPLSEFDVTRQQNAAAYLALPPRQRRNAEYINNFMFMPCEAPLPRIARQGTAPGHARVPSQS